MRIFKKDIIVRIKTFFIFVLSFYVLDAYSQTPAPGCPSIDLGPDTTISCNTPCLPLNASILDVGLTNTYTVSSLSYAPPYPYSQGTSIFVNLDDVWSELINLPFNFCFFGNTYNEIVVGANGVITFDATLASPPGCNWFTCTFCEWNFSQSMPNSTGFPYRNSINGAYHDIDPSVGGDVRYAILGAYPCRTFVVNYENVPHFQCNSITTTQQIVFYETTNIIEVYIQDKPTCNTWNDGNAVIGIQNANGTTAFTPPNRNTGPWSTTNEAWRFTPDGNSIASIEWFDNAGTPIGTGNTVTVCPTTTSTYSANVTYNRCDGTQVVETDQITVTLTGGGLPTVVANTTNTSICNGDPVTLTGSGALTYTWDNGVIDGVVFSPTSTTTYTVTGTDVNGCTNTDQITIIVNPTTSSSTTLTECDNYTWTVNGTTYTSSGTYTDVSTNAVGCTHTETLNLTISSFTFNNTTLTECDSYTWPVNGTTYTSGGTYTDVSTNAAGCTHTETLNLTITSSSSNSITLTECDNYTWPVNGTTYTSGGTYTDVSTNAAGCTHTETLNLTISSFTFNTTTLTECDSYTWPVNGTTYTSNGTYTDVSTNAAGCTHTETLNLTITSSSSNSITLTECNSYSWPVNGTTYTSGGTYTDVSTNAAGCTHVETLNLTISSFTFNNTTLSECNSYTWPVNGTTYTSGGTYTDVSTNAAGCTHTETLNLTISSFTFNTTTLTECDSYSWPVNGITYTSGGTYTDISTNAAGCTHTETLNLTISSSTSNNTTLTECDSYSWPVNGITYTSNGTYTDVSTNAAGCAHTETLNLTISSFTFNNTTLTECDSYTWLVNGTTYTQSGTYTDVNTNAAGCTHTETLNLTISSSTSNNSILTECDSYNWSVNGTTYTSNGTYTDVGTNAAGCTHIETLNLTIDLSTTSTSNETICDSYSWNGQTYTSSGTYTSSLINSAGCDSAAVLNLTINSTTTSTTDSSTCLTSGIVWNGQTYTSTGSYTYQTIGSNGCDSIATLNITFNPTTTSTTDISSCDPYSWNGNTHDSSGTYTYLINSAAGCDSIATLNLTINSSTNSLDSITACDSYSWNGSILTNSDNYTFHLDNSNGCDSVVNLVLNIIEVNLFLPNTFTPNNDNLNEQFAVYENGLTDYQIWIFNRWGEKIFYSDNSADGWDGKFEGTVSQDGVYAWRIVYTCGNELKERAGIVTILK